MINISKQLPISVLIASHNEANLLEDCLKSLWFCDEIILVDLQSIDETLSIANMYVNRIIEHPKVDMVEDLFIEHIPILKNDWVILIDPDERIDALLEK